MASDAPTPAPDLPDDWWTAEECARFLGISVATWRAYVSREQAPQPDRFFGRSPAWRPASVREWHASRPGQGWRRSESAR